MWSLWAVDGFIASAAEIILHKWIMNRHQVSSIALCCCCCCCGFLVEGGQKRFLPLIRRWLSLLRFLSTFLLSAVAAFKWRPSMDSDEWEREWARRQAPPKLRRDDDWREGWTTARNGRTGEQRLTVYYGKPQKLLAPVLCNAICRLIDIDIDFIFVRPNRFSVYSLLFLFVELFASVSSLGLFTFPHEIDISALKTTAKCLTNILSRK